jgi:hypothetical protein
MRSIVILINLLFAAGCASVPPFSPSKPVTEATSLQEGLLLCNEYKLPAEPRRPVTLRPYLTCLDELKERFPGPATASTAFTTFRDEFDRNYGQLTDATWTPRLGTEIEVAVHAVLRALWQTERPSVTPLERKLVLQDFPATARSLGAESWNVASGATFDPELEHLKAGMSSLADGEAPVSAGISASQGPLTATLCQEYLRLMRETVYLSHLSQDQYDFSQLAPQSPMSTAVREKYRQRLDNALRELGELRPKIEDARVKQGFRVLACRH